MCVQLDNYYLIYDNKLCFALITCFIEFEIILFKHSFKIIEYLCCKLFWYTIQIKSVLI